MITTKPLLTLSEITIVEPLSVLPKAIPEENIKLLLEHFFSHSDADQMRIYIEAKNFSDEIMACFDKSKEDSMILANEISLLIASKLLVGHWSY